MIDLSLNIPDVFFHEEIRSDYLVKKSIKELWAVQLDLLFKLKTVCDKYGLTYFADSGTLIGAVRHKGYIPWDDDIDIVMKREDYEKLVEVGGIEFCYPYFLQNAYSDNYMRGFSRLRNCKTTALTNYGYSKEYNHGIFIDIFPLDRVPDNPFTRRIWFKRINIKRRIMTIGVYKEPKDYTNRIKKGIAKILNIYFGNSTWSENYYKRYENYCKKYNNRKTKAISYVAYSGGKKKHIWDSSCFEDSMDVPFEFMDISIPTGYDSRLKVEYSDYMTIRHTPTTHGKMIFDVDLPYDEYERIHSKEEIKSMLGEEPS